MSTASDGSWGRTTSTADRPHTGHEQLLEAGDGKAVGHAGDVVRRPPFHALPARIVLIVLRHRLRVGGKVLEELVHNMMPPLTFSHHRRMPVHRGEQVVA